MKPFRAITTGARRGHVGLHEGIVDELINVAEREHANQVPLHTSDGPCDGSILKFVKGEGTFFDDLTKQRLPTELVKLARRRELAYFEAKTVWRRFPIAKALRVSGRPPVTVNGLTSTKATTGIWTLPRG